LRVFDFTKYSDNQKKLHREKFDFASEIVEDWKLSAKDLPHLEKELNRKIESRLFTGEDDLE
jgi:hypothetical protein